MIFSTFGVHLHPLAFPSKNSLAFKSAQTALAKCNAFLNFLIFTQIDYVGVDYKAANIVSRHALWHIMSFAAFQATSLCQTSVLSRLSPFLPF